MCHLLGTVFQFVDIEALVSFQEGHGKKPPLYLVIAN